MKLNSHLSAAALAGVLLASALTASAAEAPQAERRPQRLEAHGDVRVDDYAWLRDDSRSRPEVLAHLEAENRYAEAQLAAAAPLRRTLLAEMRARIGERDSSLPFVDGGWRYRESYASGSQQPRLERQPAAGGRWQLLLDGTERAAGQRYYRLGAWSVAAGRPMLAAAEDLGARGASRLSLRDLSSGRWLPETLELASGSLQWSTDGESLFYVKLHPQTLRPYQLYRHRPGQPQSRDALVYQEDDEAFSLNLSNTASRRYLQLIASSADSSETWLLDAQAPDAQPRRFAARQPGREYYLDHYRDRFYLRSNHAGGRFGLYRAAAPGADWETVLAPDPKRELDSFQLFRRYLVVKERVDGLTRIRRIAWQCGGESSLAFPDPSYRAWLAHNPDPDSGRLRYGYSSMSTPTSTYEWDMAGGGSRLLQRKAIAGYRAGEYRSERVWLTMRDGARAPVSLVYRKSLFRKGRNPLLAYGYGAYGTSMDAAFGSQQLSLLDRGFVFAIVHVRGGGELGEDWYRQGQLERKSNSFNDFVDAGRGLLRQGYAAPGRLYAMGGSAGGLLVAAAMNQAPELFRAVVAQVPFVDVLSSMQDPTLPLTTGEYGEWGNPERADAYRWIKAYSPYDNVAARRYPHLLVSAGLHDGQVPYWEPAKWVAKLRERQWPGQRLLLFTDMSAGHRGQSGRLNRLEAAARDYAFLLTVDAEPPSPPAAEAGT